MLGTNGNDLLLGGVGNDTLNGLLGDDTIWAMDGNDIVFGGLGNDIIGLDGGNDIAYGGDGNDVLYGGAGDDSVYAGAGNDFVFGGSGDDTVGAGDGHDMIWLKDGDDQIFGGDGNDIMGLSDGSDIAYGGSDNDQIFGGSGNDQIFGGSGDDLVFGGSGNDVLYGGAGDDSVYAGAGNDNVGLGAGSNYLDGGDGIDTINIGGGPVGLRELANGDVEAYRPNGDISTLHDFEFVNISGKVISLDDYLNPPFDAGIITHEYGMVNEDAQKPGTDDVVIGTGIPADDFVITNNESYGIQMGLMLHKYRGASYQPDSVANGQAEYTVDAGASPLNAARGDLSINYVVLTGQNGLSTELDTFNFRIGVDTDLGSGVDMHYFDMAHLGPGNTPFVDDPFTGGFADEDGSSPILANNDFNPGGFNFLQDIIDGDPNTPGNQLYTGQAGELQFSLEAFTNDWGHSLGSVIVDVTFV